MEFTHERLDVYRLALDVARWARRQHLPAADAHLRDQLVRAADSMVLNIAEGCGRDPGNARRNHYRIAAGSAAEVGALLDLVALREGSERQGDLRRIAAMLYKLARR